MTEAVPTAEEAPATSPVRRPPAGGRLPAITLVVLAVAPALAVLPGLEHGHLAFLEYREPKLLVALLAATAFVALFAAYRGLSGAVRDAARSLARCPELAVLAALLGYALVGEAWVAVRANWWYELRQYSLFFAVALLVRAWGARDPRVGPLLVTAICSTTSLLVVVGLAQAAGGLPWLVPLDPGYGVSFPSLLGYKNPMALAVVGQIFLLPLLALYTSEAPWPARRRTFLLAGLALAFAGECAYLAFLQSRTSYVALAVGLALLVGVGVGGRLASGEGADVRRRRRFLLLAASGVLGALALSFGLHGELRARFASVKVDYVDGWARSDRATYLLNSLAMVRDRPLGVGLGDWQTYYPVYRPWNPHVAFSETVQPRRAHDDHAQLAAELGVPGLLLWVAFWSALLGGRFFPRDSGRRLASRLLGVQCAVFFVAMAGDYVLEQPYLKLQFFLLLALGAGPAELGMPRLPVRAAGGIGRRLVLGAVLLVLGATAWEVWASTARLYEAGLARYHFARWLAARGAGGDPGARDTERREVLRAGERFVAGRGLTKADYKDYLAVAEAALADGRPALANDLAWEALRLHPYSSQGFRLLAKVWEPVDPAAARDLLRLSFYVLDGPRRGFRLPYPRPRPYPGG